MQKSALLNSSLEGLCWNQNNENTITTLLCCWRGYNGEPFQCSSGRCPVIVKCDQREVFTLDMISLEESEETEKKTTQGFSRRSLCLSAWTLRLFKTGTVPWASEWSYEHSNAQRQGALSADHYNLDTFTSTRLLNTVVTSLLSA